MTRALRIIYILTFTPLIIGSTIFFYWFYKREWFAENALIELPAFFTIIGYFLFTLINIILLVRFFVKNKTEWKKLIIPFFTILFTFLLITLYDSLHSALSQKAFIHIINDTNYNFYRIWSDNFEQDYNRKEENFITSYYPVYTYDWNDKISDEYGYKLNPVYIDLKDSEGSVITYELPYIDKGDCITIHLSKLEKRKTIIKRGVK